MNGRQRAQPRICRPRFAFVVAGVACAAACTGAVAADAGSSPASSPAAESARTVVFTALLDGKPIGEHRYSVEPHDGGERLHSVASFDVKFLGITAYRYRHDDAERWTGAGCLADLKAVTDDGGDKATVTARPADGGLAIATPKGRRTATGCVTTFPSFYWHAGAAKTPAPPASLLNPQDGRDEAVQVDDAASASVDVRGATVQARHVRIARPDGPIDLWYAADGAWIGLDAQIKGKRLSYRLR